MKRLQNKVADSRAALPVTAVYAAGIWLICGLMQEGWWLQFGCFAISTFLMVLLNNSNALIRIYSRMVSCTFLAFSCAACFLFSSLHGHIFQCCFLATYLCLFSTFQNPASIGITYYGFLCLGIASIAQVNVLWLVPVLWLMMITNLQSFSLRTFLASILGVLTPYWLMGGWMFYNENTSAFMEHFIPLTDLHRPFDFSLLNVHQISFVVFLVILGFLSTIHFWQTSYLDKFRVRQIYGIFIRMNLITLLLICLQPQHIDILTRLLIINSAPLVGHFIALTKTRLSNIVFCIIVLSTLALTAYNIWM